MKIHAVIFLLFPLTIRAQVNESFENAIGNRKENTINSQMKRIPHNPAGSFDIVMNEIMVDPDPPVGLPVAEYIELLNTSDTDITALGWTLSIGEKKIPLPSFQIKKFEYLLVCEAGDSLLLNPYGPILPVKALPALKNEGQTLTLSDMSNDIIHTVSYSGRWYGNSLKSEGGWSLEMIDPENPCGKQENWAASEHYLGGTPGSSNSINRYNPDNSSPVLLRAATTSDTGLLVSFSEPLLITGISDPFQYSVDHNIFHPSVAEPIPPDFSSVQLTFPVKFSASIIYELMVQNSVCDCAGNRLADSYTEFGLAFQPDSFDLVINEVLFDAREDEEFVEIINRSDRITELSSLALVLLDEYTGTFRRKLHEFKRNFQLLPGQYAVITGSVADLQNHYACKAPAAVIEADKVLDLPDDAGAIALVQNSARQIDCFFYDAGYHFELITDPEGISLERIFTDYPTNDRDNWHSAAEDAGFGTPGYKNSQSFLPSESPALSVWTEPEVFTPDNDGNDDFLAILFRLDDRGSLANVIIFDSRGKLVRRLANNSWLGAEGFLTWDGTNTEGDLEKAGIYIVYTEILSENGTVRKFTSTCVLSKEPK
jgi:hypothetical protein